MIKMECQVRTGNANIHKLMSVGFASNKENYEFNERIDELLNQIQKHWN